MTDAGSLHEFIAAQDVLAHEEFALVSPDMPLRANLTVLDNIALIPQFRRNLEYDSAADLAWSLLAATGYQDIHAKRDPALSHAERFVAKLMRAVIGQPATLLIDRPAMLLPEVHYPPFLLALLEKLEAHLQACWIVDYQWNQVLYHGIDKNFPEITPTQP